MTEPRNLPPDLALADWDSLLEGVEGPSPAAPPAGPVSTGPTGQATTPSATAKTSPGATPPVGKTSPGATSPAARTSPGATPPVARPSPRATPPVARTSPGATPPGTAKTAAPPPPLPSLHPPRGPVLFESYEDEDERTVVGEVPRELLNSTRDIAAAAPIAEAFFPSGAEGEPKPKSARSSIDDDRSVVTSAREFLPQRRPPLPTPRPAAGRSSAEPQTPRPSAGRPSAEPSSPFEDTPLPRPPGVPTPVSTRMPRARNADLTPPVPVVGLPARQEDAPYGQGPQLFAPLQRDFSPDDATDVLDLREETVLRANLDAAYSRDVVREGVPPGRPPSGAPSFDVSLSELPPPGHGDDRRTARPDAIGTGSIPPRAGSQEPFFPDERPALSYLEEASTVDAFRERAAWLADEARHQSDRNARAGLLLTVSELWAMAGDDARADEAAAEAVELAPQLPFAHRQARAGAARRGDTAAMLDGLDAETRVAPSPQARAHAAFVGAEICRALGDRDGASKRLELAARAHPVDPRPHIAKAAPALGEPGQAPRYRWADTMALAPLVHASASLAAMRGAFDQAPRSPYEALPRARAAWAEGRPGEAADALTALQQLRTIGEGALWLASSLASLDREARPKVIEPLETLQNGPHPVLASRALADAKLELGDIEGARGVITVGRTFGDAEQVAFGALTGAPAEDLAAALSALDEEPERAPLAAAVEALSEGGRTSTAVGDPGSRALAALGRALARGESDLESRMLDVVAANAEGAVVRALELEAYAESGAAGDLAAALAAWPQGPDGTLEDERDRALAASLVYELGRDADRALVEARRALDIDPGCEPAARVSLAHDGESAPEALEALAGREDVGPLRAALWLIEAALRRAERGENVQELLERSHELAPELPFASALGSRLGRSAGDLDAVLRWVRRRRDASDDLVETAHELVREALLVAGEDEALAASLLDQACVARPEDVALRELCDRLAPEPRPDRNAWLAARADAAEGPARARFSLLAAWAFEQAGEHDRAARYAARAVEAGAGELATLARERAEALGPGGATRLREELMEAARKAPSPVEEREAYEKLAALERAGGKSDPASGLLWHRSILEIAPSSLPSLRHLEQALVAGGREDELEPLFAEVSKHVEGAEAAAHARAAARLRLRNQPWETTLPLVERAVTANESNLWALRQLFAHARARNDHAALFRAARALGYETDQPVEQASLFFRSAEAAAAAGRRDEALELVAEVLDRVPEYAPAHLLQVELLVQAGAFDRAALALEEAAAASHVRTHQARFYHHAATLWLERVGDRERGSAALESAVECDPTLEGALARLQALYVETGERSKLALLLERRLQGVSDPAERARLEVERGRALAEVGDVGAAKLALAAALEHNPDHLEALRAFADVCASEGDWEGVERGLLHLVRVAAEPEAQIELYRRLGRLYEGERPDPERAESAYNEVLRRAPNDDDAREHLVALFSSTGDLTRALQEQQALVTAAGDDGTLRRRRVVDLARLYEQGGDVRKAETTLDGLRKEAPQDPGALRALAEFHLRRGNAPAANVLLDRTAADARRALTTGRFDLHFFANLTTVFELRGRPDAALVASATLAALEGRPGSIEGRGQVALSPELDDLIAPELFTPAFRNLLRQAGDALDGATALDLRGMRATPLPPEAESAPAEAFELAQAFGFEPLHLYVAPSLGAVCLPVASNPPTLVLGPSLLHDQHRPLRTFLFLRALKILKGHVASFARTAPIELWPLVAAFLQTFSPQWQPQGVDPNKLQDYRARIQRSMPANSSDDAAVLALEVIASLGNRASTLQTASNAWGNRCALLALGDMSIALSSIASAAGVTGGPPPGGPERLTWVGRNAEARDLVIYSVSDAFFEARARG